MDYFLVFQYCDTFLASRHPPGLGKTITRDSNFRERERKRLRWSRPALYSCGYNKAFFSRNLRQTLQLRWGVGEREGQAGVCQGVVVFCEDAILRAVWTTPDRGGYHMCLSRMREGRVRGLFGPIFINHPAVLLAIPTKEWSPVSGLERKVIFQRFFSNTGYGTSAWSLLTATI